MTVTERIPSLPQLEPLPRGVVLAATPLGNIGDASLRLIQALGEADTIAAEDTRRTRALADALGVTLRGQLVSNFDHNEADRLPRLLDAARRGTVLVVTDAGMPVVSDPGYTLVDAALDAGIPVTCLPGPSAVTTSLALSGVGAGKFSFDGFAPRKDGQRRQWLESLKGQNRATVFFESPHRLAATLAVAAEVLGAEHQAAVCRELTKKFEEVRRGGLGELAQWAEENARGEIAVVLDAAGEDPVDIDKLVAQARTLEDGGMRLKEACKQVAKGTEFSNREVYDAALNS